MEETDPGEEKLRKAFEDAKAMIVEREEVELQSAPNVSYDIAKIVPLAGKPTGLDIERTSGKHVVVSCSDRLILCNVEEDSSKTVIPMRANGVALARFTHASTCLIEATGVGSEANSKTVIRYHSILDNSYLRTFSGHTNSIISLRMAPTDDQFYSSALDQTCRIWDLRQPETVALLEGSGEHPV